jgi:hypothetical protein
VTTSGPLLDIDMSEVIALQRELRAVSKDFANAVNNELREPVRRATSDFKFAARTLFPKWAAADAAAMIRSTSSTRSGYAIKREDGKSGARFTQGGYVDKTGAIRHPLYGNRDYWYDTDVGAQGWWSNMEERVVPRATEEFTAAMLRIMDRLATGNLSTRSIATGKTRTKTGKTRTKTVL